MPLTSTAPTKWRKPRGMTLLEIMISTALIAVVFVAVFAVMVKGLRFFRLTSDAQDRQREALNFVSRLSAQLLNSRPSLIYVPSGPSPAGISYATPITQIGTVRYEPTGALRLLWQAYGVFYIDANRNMRWLRQEMGTSTATPVGPFAAGVRPETFAASSTSGVLIVKDVTRFTVQRWPVGTLVGGPGGVGAAGGLPSKSDFYDVVLELGKRDDPLGYWLQVRSSFYPRN